MKILVGPDSFKDSVSAEEFCEIAKELINTNWPDDQVITVPLADGGEGTVDALVAGQEGEFITCQVHGPLSEDIVAKYGMIEDGKVAVIEMAEASGLPLVPVHLRNPMKTTTYGTGELILDAIKKGVKKIIVGIGGSATSDAGLGMLQALDFKCLDKSGDEIDFGGDGLLELDKIISPVNSSGEFLYEDIEFLVACDVNSPLYGPDGAAYVYGPQKGASEEMVAILDDGLKNFAKVVEESLDKDVHTLAGGGAAGGLGACIHAALNGQLKPGFEIIREQVELDGLLEGVDLIITAEGQMNHQSLKGKLPVELSKLGKSYGAKAIVITGSRDLDLSEVSDYDIMGVYPIANGPISLTDSMAKGKELIKDTLLNVLTTIHAFNS